MNLKEAEKYSLSDEDLRNLLGSSIRIVTYPDLANAQSIEDLMDSHGRLIILFLTESEQEGHWQCVIDHGPYIEFFDSYGIKPSGNRRWLTKDQQIQLGQTEDLLKPLLLASGKPVVYNRYRFQRGKNVNTCGRHCASRLLFKDFDLNEYLTLIELSGMPPDQFVTEMTFEGLRR